MPRILSDDGVTAQVETDDGRIVNVASQQAPGTMEYLQGIQNIKPFSGPPTPIQDLAQASGIDPMNPADQDIMNRLKLGGYDAMAAIKDLERRRGVIQSSRDADIAANEVAAAEQNQLNQGLQSYGLGKPVPQQGMTGAQIVPPATTTDQGVSGPREGRVDVAPMSQAGDERSGLDKAFDAKISAARKAAEIGQQTAIAQKAQYDTMASLFQQDAERQQAINQQRDVMLADRMAKYDQTMNEYSKMQVKNPWADASTGTKIGAALAMLVGAVGAGAAGQENLAMKVINQAIDKDIDLQLKNIDKKGNELGQQKGYLDMVRTQFADEDSRRTALRDMYLSSLEGKLKSISANNEQLMASPRMIDTIASLNMERERLRGEMMKNQADMLDKVMKAQSGGMEMANFVPGLGYAYDKEDAKQLRTLKSDVESAMGGIDELIQISSKPAKSLSIEDRSRAETIQASLIGKLRVALTGPGAMSEGDRALLERAIRNPTSFFSLDSANRTALQTLKSTIAKSIDANAQNKIVGYQPGSYGGGMSQEQLAASQWLQQNPNDPRAPEIRKRLGL